MAARKGPDGQLRLVVVESPNKAKTIAGYLGDGYVVESSIGHIRDLPRGAADVPAKYKGEAWARLGVDTDHGFEPLYIVPPDKKAQVAKLKALLTDATELYLATDEDREGEAIAWHLLETLKPKVPVKRMVFHEITKAAIQEAANNPRDIDDNMVDAQETRRILDRLYGYEVSPVLWKKVMPKLSAGRVQSVATRIIVERERARMAFVSGTYWGLDARFAQQTAQSTASTFGAALSSVDGRRIASGRDFDESTGKIKTGSDVLLLDADGAQALTAGLAGRTATVTSVEEKPYTRKPYPPFMTSTLQQEAGRKFGFATERTMRTAQKLYEGGYITYMRTDSTTLSQTALDAARSQARELYGPEYVPSAPRQYTKKVKNAQEAHEAIRPSGEQFRTPGEVARQLTGDEFRLYELIWQRTIASQMVDARGLTLQVRIAASTAATATGAAVPAVECVFNASGRTITFPGFLRAYVETVDAEAGGDADDAEKRLPKLEVGQLLDTKDLTPGSHSTSPPARYTEPSLIKAMEDLGIGRPSTYSSIIRTITDRGYVWRKGQALVPSWVAFAVVGLLEQHFGRLVDYNFTAAMEDELDEIAGGRMGRVPWLTAFYFGGETGPLGGIGRAGGLKKLVGENLEEIDAREVNSLPLVKDSQGRQVTVRVGRYGPYLERPVGDGSLTDDGKLQTERANLPDELAPDEVTTATVDDLFSKAEAGDKELGVDPGNGNMLVAKDGRYGPYVTEVLPEDTPTTGKNAVKPRTGSLLRSMSLETVTLADALKLLSLPRLVGADPGSGDEITAQNGRYGPYLKKGTDSRSLTDEEQLFTVTLDEALAIYAQPKTRGRNAATAPPLRELGVDPATDKPMVIKDGRFGPYVTDGETNASLRKGDEVESLTIDRGAELLADRRANGPAAKKPRKAPTKPKSTTTRTVKKKAAAKKSG
jgi:DNA topoisomerase-1